MSTSEVAWAAGLFEGEGTITHSGGRPRLALKMTDDWPVRRFAEIVGGSVYGPYRNRTGEHDGYPRKDFYMWVAEGKAGARAARMMEPFLSPARLKRLDDLYPNRHHVETP